MLGNIQKSKKLINKICLYLVILKANIGLIQFKNNRISLGYVIWIVFNLIVMWSKVKKKYSWWERNILSRGLLLGFWEKGERRMFFCLEYWCVRIILNLKFLIFGKECAIKQEIESHRLKLWHKLKGFLFWEEFSKDGVSQLGNQNSKFCRENDIFSKLSRLFAALSCKLTYMQIFENQENKFDNFSDQK